MTDWPILSAVTFLPLVGVALLLLTQRKQCLGPPQCPEHLAADDAGHLRAVADRLVGFR